MVEGLRRDLAIQILEGLRELETDKGYATLDPYRLGRNQRDADRLTVGFFSFADSTFDAAQSGFVFATKAHTTGVALRLLREIAEGVLRGEDLPEWLSNYATHRL